MRILIPMIASLLPLLALLLMGTGAGPAAGAVPPTAQPPTGPSPVELPADSAIRCPLLPKDREGDVCKVAYSPDGRTLLAGGGDFVRLFDPATGRAVAAYKPGGGSVALAFAQGGLALAAPVAVGRLALLEPTTGRPIRGLDPPAWDDRGWDTAATCSPDGRTVAGAFSNGEVALWDAATGRLTRVLPAHIIPAHAVGPNKEFIQPPTPVEVLSLAFSPDGATLFGSSQRLLRAWDVASGRERPMERPAGCSFDCGLAVSPDGATLAIGQIHIPEGSKIMTHSIALWDAATGRRRTELATEACVLAVGFLPGGRSLAALEHRRTLRLWDLASGRPTAAVRFEEHFRFEPSSSTISLAVSPDGKQVAIGGYSSDPMFGVIGLVEVDGQKLGPWKPKP